MSTDESGTFETEISDVAVGGDGVGRAPDGRVTFVRGGVPGDTLVVEVREEHDNHVKADVCSVVAAAPTRVEPPCPYVADGCGGCGWQHVSLDAQREAKRNIVVQALERIGKVDLGDVDVRIDDSLTAEGFRTTVRLGVVGGRAGFRAARSDDVVPVDSCLVAHPFLRDLFGVDWGAVEEVTLRCGARTGERLALGAPSLDPKVRVPADVVLVGRDDLKRGASAFFHEEVAGHRFRISARSFFQSRADGADALVRSVRRAGGDVWRDGRLADLYAGVGLFAATNGAAMEVVAVESNRSSAADARVNLDRPDARVVRDEVVAWKPARVDVVVADPPREGLRWRAADVVAATGAPTVVLVSCDAGSLGRDAGLLEDRGYRLSSVEMVDLFPHTPHVEAVCGYVLR